MAVLARDKAGAMQGLWFERASFSSAMATEAKAIHNACIIAKDKNFLKVIIERDCEAIVVIVLGYSIYPWSIYAIIEDIRLFFTRF